MLFVREVGRIKNMRDLSKSPRESAVTMTEIVLPTHTNILGNIFGGVVMSWIDIAAAISAGRHARHTVVTVAVDALHFIAPIKLGQIVEIKACVNYVARTSMEVGVRVTSEDPKTGVCQKNVKAYVTFVALDDSGQPTPVPPLNPESSDEKRRFEAAKKRRKYRMAQSAQP